MKGLVGKIKQFFQEEPDETARYCIEHVSHYGCITSYSHERELTLDEAKEALKSHDGFFPRIVKEPETHTDENGCRVQVWR